MPDSVAVRDRQVVSTGGGAPTSPRNRATMRENGIVVCLEARPETILARLEREGRGARGPVARPMLEARDAAARVRALKAERQPAYALADWTVHTDRLSPAMVAEEVARALTSLSARAVKQDGDGDLAATVRTSVGDYPVWAGWGALDSLGQRVRDVVGARTAYVVSDEGVYTHARRAQTSLEAAGIPAHLFSFLKGRPSRPSTL